MDIFIEFINWLIEGASESLEWLFGLLPDSPTQSFQNEKPELVTISYITWFIPFPTMLLHFSVILSAIGIYYVYRIIARWLKVVRS